MAILGFRFIQEKAGKAYRRFIYRPFKRKQNSRSYFFGLLFDLFVKELRIEERRYAVPYNLTERDFRTRFFWKTYEMEERAALKKFLPRDAAVLELGACIGVVSGETNALLQHPEKHVVCEANPALLETLQYNRDRNACKFKIEHAMVSRSSDGTFFVHDLIVGGSAQRQTEKKIRVPVKTVEQLEEQHGLRFNVLIMDIEGGEIDFLDENPHLLNQLTHLFIEWHPFIIDPVIIAQKKQLLGEHGFELADQQKNVEVWRKP